MTTEFIMKSFRKNATWELCVFFCLGDNNTSIEVAGSPMWTESQAFGAPPDLSVLQTYEENKSAFKNVTNVLVKCILLGVWINKQTIANIDNLHGWPEHLTETKYNVNCFAWLKITTKKNHNLRWSTSAAHQFSTHTEWLLDCSLLVWIVSKSFSLLCAAPMRSWGTDVTMVTGCLFSKTKTLFLSVCETVLELDHVFLGQMN